MKIVAGNSNIPLAKKISQKAGVPLAMCTVQRFADSEVFVEIMENMRGEDIFVIQPTSYPANDNLMELLIIIDAVRRASARRITAVMPYFGYARQDRKPGPRTPISAKLVANLITKAGADRVLTLDLHAGQIQGFFDIPTDNLFASPVMIEHAKKYFSQENTAVVSPDVGGVVRARAFAKGLNVGLVIVDKRRDHEGASEVMNIIGDVRDKRCIIVDDIIDSGGTVCNAAKSLLQKGAQEVVTYSTHGVLSGDAIKLVEKSPMQKLCITDSIFTQEATRNCSKVEIISVAPLIGEAIRRIVESRSISNLFHTDGLKEK